MGPPAEQVPCGTEGLGITKIIKQTKSLRNTEQALPKDRFKPEHALPKAGQLLLPFPSFRKNAQPPGPNWLDPPSASIFQLQADLK